MNKNASTATVTLSKPVKIDGEEVTKITLRKPMAGELRGLKLTDVLQMDVNAIIGLVPRISMPPLMDDQVANEIELEDFTDICTKVALFFTKDQAAVTAPKP